MSVGLDGKHEGSEGKCMKRVVISFTILVIILVISMILSARISSPKKDFKKVAKVFSSRNNKTESEWIKQKEKMESVQEPVLTFPEVDAEAQTYPMPVEWEELFFDILDNSKSREERNSRLYLFAITTARNSPRVQEECLAHLAFGINNSEKEFAFEVLKDMRISDSARILMFKNMDTVRPDEFMYFLSSNLMKTLPSSELKQKVAQSLLEFQNANQK